MYVSQNKFSHKNVATSRTAVVSKPNVGRGRGISRASVPKPINLPSHASTQQQGNSASMDSNNTNTQNQANTNSSTNTGAWGTNQAKPKEETVSAPKQAWTKTEAAPTEEAPKCMY